MLVAPTYRGLSGSMQPWTTGLTVRCMRRLFTDEKSRAEIVTCRKVDAELVERWPLIWAQVDRL